MCGRQPERDLSSERDAAAAAVTRASAGWSPAATRLQHLRGREKAMAT
jgi:hypothetical protein